MLFLTEKPRSEWLCQLVVLRVFWGYCCLSSSPAWHDVETMSQRTLMLRCPSLAHVVNADFDGGFNPSEELNFDGMRRARRKIAIDGFLD